jgi:hypothetical protein
MHNLWTVNLRFWIGAPETFKGTPFEEDRCPYSRAVMYGISLDIENGSEAGIHQ